MITGELKTKALEVATRAAKLAGERAKEIRSSKDFKVSIKGESRDLVTEADLQCEKLILDTIRETFPDHQILSEESNKELLPEMAKGPLWIIDPIDGTTNFAHGQVHVGVSIGFAYDGLRQAAVVDCPFLNELYTATRGGGAFCNGERISVSNTSSPERALICTGFPYQRENLDGVLRRFSNCLRTFGDMRRLGAAAVDLCWTASGKIDAFYEDIMPWDVAAGLLVASEAGAEIFRFEEASDYPLAWNLEPGVTPDEIDGTNIVVCSPGISNKLREVLAKNC